jgi:hypothetical protein
MADFFHCPRKHKLPHGLCTPARCEVETNRTAKVNQSKRRRIRAEEQMSEAIITGDDTELEAGKRQRKQDEEFGFADARRQFRLEKTGTPKDLKGADADRYVEAEIQNLQVEALAEQKYRLYYGDDDERNEASRLILAAGGHGPRDPREGGAAVIIVAGDVSRLPWSKPPIGSTQVPAQLPATAPGAQTVEAAPVPTKESTP